jgi:hypothetical protein
MNHYLPFAWDVLPAVIAFCGLTVFGWRAQLGEVVSFWARDVTVTSSPSRDVTVTSSPSRPTAMTGAVVGKG